MQGITSTQHTPLAYFRMGFSVQHSLEGSIVSALRVELLFIAGSLEGD
jgi:hypothetical protein